MSPALARLALVVPAVLTLLTGCSSTPNTANTAGTAAPRPSTSLSSPATTTVGTPTPSRGAPTEVTIPSIGISGPLMELGLNADGTVEVPPPEKGMTAGWYVGGPAPGEAGPAVIIGHNSTRFGKAVFHDLHKISKGADITVANDRGKPVHFTVTDTESVGKGTFPTEKVYGPTDEHALRLITCDGDFDAEGHPVNNLIVYATRT
ncbi:class F sortase [Streptomyces paludis]|uniref:class F sortase n=1 Tax=Streptomyces paludis TaxID=2282738 RepID=UPI001E31C9DC|nr:class F sortase [Streptomyces paludis]